MTGNISGMIPTSLIGGGELVEVSQLSGTVRITATTISAEADDNSFNDSADGFLTAGFAIGDRVNVTGFTGDVANNLFVGVVTDVTAGKLTIGGTDGDVIVDDAAGESVTIAKWVTRRASAADLGRAGSPIVTKTTTAEDLLNADVGAYARYTATGGKTLTVRPNATEALTDNGEWHLRNAAASGNLTIAEGSGVTINEPAGGSLILEPGMAATLKRVAINQFDLIGHTQGA